MNPHQPLGGVAVVVFQSGEDGPVLLGGGGGTAPADRSGPGLLDIVVEQGQHLLQRAAAAALIDDLMEPLVQVAHLEIVPPAQIELLQLHDLPQVGQFLLGDVLGGTAGGKALHLGADQIDIVHIAAGNAHHHGALVVGGLDQTFQFQLTKCFPDRSTADAALCPDCRFL